MKNFTTLLTILLVAIASMAHASLSVTFSTITNVKCFGGRDGALITSVSGGTSPYTYLWSTGATTANISALPAGYYAVTVTDNLGATASRNGTLTEPTALSFTKTPSVYNTSFNISLYGACNGYINTSASGGTSPYTYLWSSGQTTANVTNLCASVYSVTLTDANLCTVNTSQSMTEPDKASWDISGNSGSNPSSQFIGTTDSVDFVFKSKNIERARVKANGDFNINRLITNRLVSPDTLITFGDSTIVMLTNFNRIYTDNKGLSLGINSTGVAALGSNSVGIGSYSKTASDAANSIAIGNHVCAGSSGTTATNAIIIGSGYGTNNGSYFHNWIENSLMVGFNSNKPTLYVGKSNGSGTTGLVTIGVEDPGNISYAGGATAYKLIVDGKIGAHDVVVVKSSDPWPDYVFSKDYKLKSLSEIKKYLKTHNHLPDFPEAMEIEKNGQHLGEIQVLHQQSIEEIYLQLINLNDRLSSLEKENTALKKEIKVLQTKSK